MRGSRRVVAWSWLAVAHLRTRIERMDTGQSTVEYALVGALVVIAAAAAMTGLGGQVNAVFSHITATLAGAAPAAH